MITAEQRQLRKRYLGSSEAAAVLGVDPYSSAADVWLVKTGRAEGFEGNKHTERGNLLEPVLLNWCQEKIGQQFSRDTMLIHPNELLAANFDGLGQGEDGVFVVEAKSMVSPDELGEEGTNEVPDRVLIQTHHQMVVAHRRLGIPVRLAYVPVLVPAFRDFDFRLYRVPFNEELGTKVEQGGTEFMERFVRNDTPPDDYRPTLEVLKRVRREPDKIVTIPDVAVSLWQQAKGRLAVVKAEYERAEADLIACMGDAEGGTCTLGAVTYMNQTRKAYAVKETTFRTLRFKKAKESGK